METTLVNKTINRVVLIDVNLICPNPAQPRVLFDERELANLAQSITQNGLLQPITVRRCDNDKFELVSGERRLRALKYAKADYAPCIIVDTSDKQSAIFALLENLQREDLNYFEEAYALKSLVAEWGVSQQELGERLGKAQSTIANKLRLLKFDSNMQQLLVENRIGERQARALLKIDNKITLNTAIGYIISRNLNVTQTEQYVESLLNKSPAKRRVFHPIIKDVRIFINTINHAVTLMKQSGIQAVSEKVENDDYIEYTVRIPVNHEGKKAT